MARLLPEQKLRGNKDLSKGSLRGVEETNDTRSTRLKEKSRVSFAVRDLENVRAVSFSDSEIGEKRFFLGSVIDSSSPGNASLTATKLQES